MRALALIVALLLQTGASSRAPGVISGQVQGLTGGPAAGIRVMAQTVPDPKDPTTTSMMAGIAETDAAGRYRLDNIPPGRYFITAGLLDFPTYYPGVKTQEDAKILTLAPGAVIADANFTLARPAGIKVSGQVSGMPRNLPAGIVRVMLTPTGAVRIGGPVEAMVRPDGSFEFSKVAPGTYGLRMTPTSTPALSANINVDDKDIKDLSLTLPPILTGRVTIDDGTPLPVQAAARAAGISDAPAQARLVASRGSNGTGATAAVRADGFFFLTNLSEGEHNLAFNLLPFGLFIKSITFGSANATESPLKVPSRIDPDTPPILITLTTVPPPGVTTGVTVSGKVTGLPEGPPASPRFVTMQSANTTPISNSAVRQQRIGEASVRDDGSFSVLRVPPGAYVIRVLNAGAGLSGASTSVTVGETDITDVEIPVVTLPTGRIATSTGTLSPLALSASRTEVPLVQPGVKVSGQVSAATTFASTAQAVALFSNGSNPSFRSTLAADGSFEFPKVPPGSYDVALLPITMLPAYRELTVGNADITGLKIDPAPSTMVRGRVILANGARPKPFMVTLRFEGPEGHAWFEVHDDGAFSGRLPSNEYRVTAPFIPSGFKVQSIRAGARDLLAAPLKLEGATSEEIVVTLETAR